MLKLEHSIPDFISVALVYGIIICEFYSFIFIYLPAYYEKVIVFQKFRMGIFHI